MTLKNNSKRKKKLDINLHGRYHRYEFTFVDESSKTVTCIIIYLHHNDINIFFIKERGIVHGFNNFFVFVMEVFF